MSRRIALAIAIAVLSGGCAHKPPVDAYLSDLQEQIDVQRKRVDRIEGRVWTDALDDSVIEDSEAEDEDLSNAEVERKYLGAEWIAYRDSLLNAQWEKRHKGGK